MTRDTKLLQAILDSQVKMRKEMKDGFKKVHGRLDMQGSQLKKRLEYVDTKIASI